MVFSSLAFVIVFLPVFFLFYFFLPKSLRNIVILVGSLIFYYYGIREYPYYLILILSVILVNYILARQIEWANGKTFPKLCLAVGLTYNFGSLFIFKYLDFVLENWNFVLEHFETGHRLPYFKLILPIGISFYTFQISSYLIDVYRKQIRAEKSFLKLATYLCLFPQLIAGPIVTYSKVFRQLDDRTLTLANTEEGMREFTLGLASKVLIANRVGGLWNQVVTIGFESISTPLAWLGIIAYSLQIYFDFYGYSLMAKGLGRIMGFTFPDNFRRPYLAKTMTDFWRRWHITLGTWFREYVYIPMGGKRKHGYRNLFIVWMLTGLWHGASWNYLLWGLICFVLIALERMGLEKIFNGKPWLGHCYMILVIPLFWLVFAVTDLGQIGIYFSRLFPFLAESDAIVYGGDYIKYLKLYAPPLIAALIFMLPFPGKIYRRERTSFWMNALLVGFFWMCLYSMYQGLDDPFLYYQF